MLISLAWLNRLLDPPTLSGDEAERALTNAGFPLESREPIAAQGAGARAADERLDVEITSNRGDCLCHLGLAREIAAATGRRLVTPSPTAPAGEGRGEGFPSSPSSPRSAYPTSGSPFSSKPSHLHTSTPASSSGLRPQASGLSSLIDNRAPDACPRFTARIIRGVKVAPSPKWLVQALESVGQRSINNIVDASNFVLFEMGNPSHAFDLNALAEKRLIIRYAKDGERLTALDGKTYALKPDELVVADAERARSLAGIIGGLDSGVTDRTTDLLVEMATWDPATIRRAARRLQIRTDASHRFERSVHPGAIDAAMDRLCALIVELAGGELDPGMADAGRPVPPRPQVTLRTKRCHDLLGIVVPPAEISRLLAAVGVENTVDARGETIRRTIPYHRAHDLTREVDLIEEVARLHGFDSIPIHETMQVSVAAPQESERAVREMGSFLAGAGFFETVTFTFLPREQAEVYLPPVARLIKVDEERRKGAPYLRPSVVPSLLACRRLNQDAGASAEGGVRLFEFGSGFQEWRSGPPTGAGGSPGAGASAGARTGGGAGSPPDGEWISREFRSLAMLIDAPDRQLGVRQMKGVIDSLVRALGGGGARVEFKPSQPFCRAHSADGTAEVIINGQPAAGLTLISDEALRLFGLDCPVVAAEILLDSLIALYPPRNRVAPLPAFPAIERDLSLIVDESTPWSRIEALIADARPALLVGLSLIGVYRGKQAGPGRKSVTLRLRFQDPARTLRHEEVDPQIAAVIELAKRDLGAEIRT